MRETKMYRLSALKDHQQTTFGDRKTRDINVKNENEYLGTVLGFSHVNINKITWG
jgi:hypothetical protein